MIQLWICVMLEAFYQEDTKDLCPDHTPQRWVYANGPWGDYARRLKKIYGV